MNTAKAKVLAFRAFSIEHRKKVRSTNPLERVDKEINPQSPPNSTPATDPQRASPSSPHHSTGRCPL